MRRRDREHQRLLRKKTSSTRPSKRYLPSIVRDTWHDTFNGSSKNRTSGTNSLASSCVSGCLLHAGKLDKVNFPANNQRRSAMAIIGAWKSTHVNRHHFHEIAVRAYPLSSHSHNSLKVLVGMDAHRNGIFYERPSRAVISIAPDNSAPLPSGCSRSAILMVRTRGADHKLRSLAFRSREHLAHHAQGDSILVDVA